MNAKTLVNRLLEADPDEVPAKSEVMRLPGWRDKIKRTEEFKYLSDRWGEDLEAGVELPAIHSRPKKEVAAIQRLQQCLGGWENNFIVQRIADGQYGILFEEEFLNPEGSDDEQAIRDAWEGPVTTEEIERDLWHRMSALETRFPQAEFSITVGPHVFNGRYAVQAFVPADRITPELGAQLSEAFSAIN
jgi:hypothetical protein